MFQITGVWCTESLLYCVVRHVFPYICVERFFQPLFFFFSRYKTLLLIHPQCRAVLGLQYTSKQWDLKSPFDQKPIFMTEQSGSLRKCYVYRNALYLGVTVSPVSCLCLQCFVPFLILGCHHTIKTVMTKLPSQPFLAFAAILRSIPTVCIHTPLLSSFSPGRQESPPFTCYPSTAIARQDSSLHCTSQCQKYFMPDSPYIMQQDSS